MIEKNPIGIRVIQSKNQCSSRWIDSEQSA